MDMHGQSFDPADIEDEVGKIRDRVLRTAVSCSNRFQSTLCDNVLQAATKRYTERDTNREVYHTNYVLTAEQKQVLDIAYPEFVITAHPTKPKVTHVHAMSRIVSNLNRALLFRVLKARGGALNEFGSNLARSIDEIVAHHCCPILSARDAVRHNNSQKIIQTRMLNGTATQKANIFNQFHPISGRGVCCDRVEDCKVTTDVLFGVDTALDINPSVFFSAMISKKASAGYLTFPDLSDMIWLDNGYIGVLEASWHLHDKPLSGGIQRFDTDLTTVGKKRKKYVSFFTGASNGYTHLTQDVLDWLLLPTVFVHQGDLFYTEVEKRPGYLTYNIRRVPYTTDVGLEPRPVLGSLIEDKTLVEGVVVFDALLSDVRRVQALVSTRFVRQLTAWLSSSAKEEAGELKASQFAMYSWSAASRVIVDGQTVQTRELLTPVNANILLALLRKAIENDLAAAAGTTRLQVLIDEKSEKYSKFGPVRKYLSNVGLLSYLMDGERAFSRELSNTRRTLKMDMRPKLTKLKEILLFPDVTFCQRVRAFVNNIYTVSLSSVVTASGVHLIGPYVSSRCNICSSVLGFHKPNCLLHGKNVCHQCYQVCSCSFPTHMVGYFNNLWLNQHAAPVASTAIRSRKQAHRKLISTGNSVFDTVVSKLPYTPVENWTELPPYPVPSAPPMEPDMPRVGQGGPAGVIHKAIVVPPPVSSSKPATVPRVLVHSNSLVPVAGKTASVRPAAVRTPSSNPVIPSMTDVLGPRAIAALKLGDVGAPEDVKDSLVGSGGKRSGTVIAAGSTVPKYMKVVADVESTAGKSVFAKPEFLPPPPWLTSSNLDKFMETSKVTEIDQLSSVAAVAAEDAHLPPPPFLSCEEIEEFFAREPSSMEEEFEWPDPPPDLFSGEISAKDDAELTRWINSDEHDQDKKRKEQLKVCSDLPPPPISSSILPVECEEVWPAPPVSLLGSNIVEETVREVWKAGKTVGNPDVYDFGSSSLVADKDAGRRSPPEFASSDSGQSSSVRAKGVIGISGAGISSTTKSVAPELEHLPLPVQLIASKEVWPVPPELSKKRVVLEDEDWPAPPPPLVPDILPRNSEPVIVTESLKAGAVSAVPPTAVKLSAGADTAAAVRSVLSTPVSTSLPKKDPDVQSESGSESSSVGSLSTLVVEHKPALVANGVVLVLVDDTYDLAADKRISLSVKTQFFAKTELEKYEAFKYFNSTVEVLEGSHVFKFVMIDKPVCVCVPPCDQMCESGKKMRARMGTEELISIVELHLDEAVAENADVVQLVVALSDHVIVPCEEVLVQKVKLRLDINKFVFVDDTVRMPYTTRTAKPGKRVPWLKCDFFCEHAICCKNGCTFSCAGGTFYPPSSPEVNSVFVSQVLPSFTNHYLKNFNILITPLVWWNEKAQMSSYDKHALAEWITLTRQALVQQMRHFGSLSLIMERGVKKLVTSDSTVSLRNFQLMDGGRLKTLLKDGMEKQWFYDIEDRKMVSSRCVRADAMYVLPSETFNHSLMTMKAIIDRAPVVTGVSTTALRGVPGCGKTYMIAQLVNKNVLPVAITTSSRDELKALLKTMGKSVHVKTVKTLDSHTYSRKLSGKPIVILDEAYSAHYGQIIFVFGSTTVQQLHLYGDDKQIPFINRVSQLPAHYSKPPSFVNYQATVSRRIPQDAAYLISKAYDMPVTTTNSRLRSMEVQYQQDYDGLQASQGESLSLTLHRAELEKLNSRAGVDNSKTKTVHSAQGASVDTVHLVREGRANESQILHKPGKYVTPHTNVAFSRHKEKFVYYTPDKHDDIASLVREVQATPDEEIKKATRPAPIMVDADTVFSSMQQWIRRKYDYILANFPVVVTVGKGKNVREFSGSDPVKFARWVKQFDVVGKPLIVVNDPTGAVANRVDTIVSYTNIEAGEEYDTQACWYPVYRLIWHAITKLPPPPVADLKEAMDEFSSPDMQDPAYVVTRLCHKYKILSKLCSVVMIPNMGAGAVAFWSNGHYSLEQGPGMTSVGFKLMAHIDPEHNTTVILSARAKAAANWTESLQKERDSIKGSKGRAYSKLKMICEKFPQLLEGDVVDDICCAPGGWTTFLREKGKHVVSHHYTGDENEALLPLHGNFETDEQITNEFLLDDVKLCKGDTVFCDYGVSDVDSQIYARNLEHIVWMASCAQQAVVKVHLDKLSLTQLTTIFAGYSLFGMIPVCKSSSEFWMIKGIEGLNSAFQLGARAARATSYLRSRAGGWLGNYYKVSEALVGEPGQLYPEEKVFDANPEKKLSEKRQLLFDTIAEYNRFDDEYEEITAFSFPTKLEEEKFVVKPPVDDCVMLMQNAYDEVLPEISVVPLQHDAAHMAFSGVSVELNDVSFPMGFGRKNLDNSTVVPQLRTAVSSDMHDTLVDHLLALSKRNCAVLDQTDESDAVFSVAAALSKFFAHCCHDRVDELLREYKEKPCYPTRSALKAYSATLETAKMNSLLAKGVPPVSEIANDQHEQTIKKRVKNSMDYSPLSVVPRCQTVMAQSPELVSVYTHMWKTLRDRFIALLKPNWLVAIGRHGRNISDFLDHYADNDMAIEELDIKGFDKSQLHHAMTLTWTVLDLLGMPREELDRHIRCQVDTTYINYKHKIKGKMLYQNHSGIPGTILQNTILAMIAVVGVMEPAQLAAGAAVVGDDQAILNPGPPFSPDQLLRLNALWNMDAKIITPKHRSPYFCGSFLVYHDTGSQEGWHVVADAFKKVERLGRHTMTDADREELRVSLCDQFSTYRSDSLVERAAMFHSLRYGEASWDILIRSILSVADTPGAFSRLYDV